METPIIQAYDIPTFCRVYSIGRTKLYQEIKAGRLQVKKIGRRTIIPAASAELWLQNLEGTDTAPQKGGADESGQ